MKEIDAVFFDCWDTLLKFVKKDDYWNIQPIIDHCTNREEIDFSKVQSFVDEFLHTYYLSYSFYEISYEAVVNLVIKTFSIALDCSTSVLMEEVLNHLLPEEIYKASEFLSFLDDNDIPYAVLSNTIYSKKETERLIHKFYPNANFKFVLASYDIGIKKPNPLFFKTGVDMLNKDITKSMYIGDSYNQDVFGSHRAGFKYSAWLNPTHKSFDSRVNENILDDDGVIDIEGYDDLIEFIKE